MLRSQNIFATLFCQKHIEFDQSLYEKAFSVSNSGIRIFLCINFRSNVFFSDKIKEMHKIIEKKTLLKSATQ